MGDIHSRQVERDFADPATSGGRFAAEDQRLLDAEKGDAALVDQLMRDAQVRADEAVRRFLSKAVRSFADWLMRQIWK